MCVREMHCFCAADPLIVSRYAPANRLQLTAGASLKSAQRWLGGWASAAPPRQSAAGSQSLAAFRALLAEKRTKKTPCAPTNRLEFTAGCLSKERSAGWAFCAPAAPRHRAAASQIWTPAIVARRRGRRRRAMRLPTGRNSPQECLEFCTGPPVSVCLCRHWYEHCTRLPISKLRCPPPSASRKKKTAVRDIRERIHCT